MKEEYAGFWIRLGAMIIDTIILAIITSPLLTMIYGWKYWNDDIHYDPYYGLIDKTPFLYGTWDFIINFILPIIATIWFWQKFRATPGKRATKLRVVDAETGDTLTIGQSIGRYFAYLLSLLPLGLGFFWIAIDSRKQGWHDKLAGSVVVRSREKEKVSFKEKPTTENKFSRKLEKN